MCLIDVYIFATANSPFNMYDYLKCLTECKFYRIITVYCKKLAPTCTLSKCPALIVSLYSSTLHRFDTKQGPGGNMKVNDLPVSVQKIKYYPFSVE